MTLKKIFAELKLKRILKKYLIAQGIKSMVDFKKAIADRKAIIDTIATKIKSKKKIELLKAYLRLDELSENFKLIKELIENNFTSSYDITNIPFFEFQNQFRDKASKAELKAIYYKAQQNLAKNVTMDSLKTFTPHSSRLDYLITKSELQAKSIIESKNQEEEDDN